MYLGQAGCTKRLQLLLVLVAWLVIAAMNTYLFMSIALAWMSLDRHSLIQLIDYLYHSIRHGQTGRQHMDTWIRYDAPSTAVRGDCTLATA